MKLKKGILISVEGIDGSGKSSLVDLLEKRLKEENFETLKTKEPGATSLGKVLRDILQDRKFSINNKTEFLLFSADRSENINKIVIPALKSNKIVISDRMTDSTFAYQGFARGLDINFIKEVTKFATENIFPDLTIYLKIDYKTAIDRLKSRAKKLNQTLSCFEKEKEDFFKKTISGFETIFKDRDNIIEIDGTENLESITLKALEKIKLYLKDYANN